MIEAYLHSALTTPFGAPLSYRLGRGGKGGEKMALLILHECSFGVVFNLLIELISDSVLSVKFLSIPVAYRV